MSRIDEALRRGGKGVGQPDTFNVPSVRALDWFAPGTEAERAETAAPAAEPPVEKSAPAPVAVAPVAVAPVAVAPVAVAPAAAAPTPIVSAPVVLRPTAATVSDNGNAAIGASGFREKLVVGDRMGPVAVEQYRRVAALLHNAQREHGTKVVMIASAV